MQGGPATIVVGGTVRGGVLGGAIAFDQTNVNDDRLELHPGFVITSNAATGSVDTVLAGPGTDTLAFGGSGSGAFDLARIDTGAGTQQYRDFENFEVTGGVWNFSGATTRDFTVAGGTLGGTGTFGAVTVSNGGAIAPGASPGTLYMSSLVLDQTSVLQFELADPVFVGSGVNDFISVSGDVTLDGTIEITALPGFGNGIYQLMEYGNLVADNGIAVDESASPAGYDYQLFVQPQILTVSVTSEMAGGNQFWDGANQTPGNVANGRGGDGVWTRNVGNTNWTSQPGDANAGWAEEFAIFAGAAGTVSIEGPPIEFTGMQFLTSGYRLVTNNVSSELVTETAATNIRVGTGITAEIEAPITGPGGLVKQEGGTLTLSGVNLYTGGTTVAGGTLNIVGSVSGDVLVESGATLAGRTTGLTVTDLGVVTVADGGILAPGPLVVSGTSMQFSSLRLNPGSILEFELGAPTGEVEIRAGGDSLNETVIDGTVNVTALPGFGNGLYPLISFNAPNTTDNGLLLGDMPDGFDYELQRSTVISNIDVISLVVTSEMAGGNQFWDGANQTPGSVANGRGGSGVWSADAGNTNWTDMAGSANTGWAGDFAIFAGTAGTVTVEGPVDFTGMQFVTSGYQLVSGANGELVTDTATTNIRVGTGITTEIGVAISGSGGLAKQEGGTLVLSGANTYTGDTAIDGGVLLVNGSLLGGGDTVVASGATLGGVGTVSGTTVVNAGGTLAPGNSIGALTVANATFATGSIFEVELNDGGNTIGVNSDHLNVTGTATITGGTIHVTPENGTDDGTTYVPGTTYTVLTFATAGAPGGEFDAVTDDYAFLDFVDSYDASNVYLTSSLVGGGAGTCPGGLSFNQNGACGGVLSIGSGGLYMAVVNLSNAEAPGALDRLSGEIHASVQSTLIEDSRFAREAALGRLRMALGAVGADKAGTAERRVNDDVTFWGRGFGSWGDWNGNGNAAGFDRSIGGFFLGGDARVWDTVRLGAFGGYANTGFDADRRHSDGSADSWHVGVYGGTRLGNLGLRVGGAWAWHDLELDRSVAFTGFADSPSSSYDARTWQVFAEAGYRIGFEGIAFEPFAGVAHVDLHADGYDERGGQAALSSDSQDMSTTFTTIGLRAETQFQLGGTTARLTGMAGWRHAFGDVRPKAAHAFAGGSEFDVAGVPIARDAAVLDLGAAVDLVENVTLGVSYSGQFGSGFTDHGLDASIVVRF
ncbi:MAG: autotransporter domain-containing protein [Reyranellaceae bacterium]